MVTQIQNTGVISPTEMESINSTLPNPSDLQQMTFGEVNTRLRSFRSQLEAGVSSGLLAAGVDDAGRAAAIRMLRSGSTGGGQRRAAPAQPAQGGDTVTVRAPSGEERRVPRARARNLPSGWRVVE
jgi:hypothetical protein